MAATLDRTFRLGPWTVQPRLGEVSGPGGVLHLEPKVMMVLVCLAENAGNVVTRDELVQNAWDGRMVSDEVLSRCISQLRTRLDDDPRNPHYIRTVPKIGYQLLQPVEWQDEDEPAPPADESAAADSSPAPPPTPVEPHSRYWVWLAGVALVGVALVIISLRTVDPPVSTDDISTPMTLAVLPFSNLSGDIDNEFLSDGLTEDLINLMANVPDLRVVASTSSFALKGTPQDVREIARQLGVRHVLQGSVRRSGDRVRVTAALSEAENGIVQWSQTFNTPFQDIFLVQDEISASIVNELRPHFQVTSPESQATIAPTEIMPAYELVLRGRYHLRARDEAPILRSIELFEEAIRLDPGFGEAYRDLARAYALLPTYSYEDPLEMYELAEQTLERGVSMDPRLKDKVYDVRAFLNFSRWQWEAAEADFRRALELTPNDPNLHQWYSQQLAAVGKSDLALQSVLAAKKLDTLSPVINQRLAIVYQWVDEDDKAQQQFELAEELGLGPRTNPESYLVQLIRREEYDRARNIILDLQRAFQRAQDWVDPVILAMQDPTQRQEALAALDEAAAQRQISLKYLQGALVYLGDADGAVEIAFDLLNEPLDFEVEFLFARENAIVRQHPRFGELVRQIGLDTYWDSYGWPGFCERVGEVIECH